MTPGPQASHDARKVRREAAGFQNCLAGSASTTKHFDHVAVGPASLGPPRTVPSHAFSLLLGMVSPATPGHGVPLTSVLWMRPRSPARPGCLLIVTQQTSSQVGLISRQGPHAAPKVGDRLVHPSNDGHCDLLPTDQTCCPLPREYHVRAQKGQNLPSPFPHPSYPQSVYGARSAQLMHKSLSSGKYCLVLEQAVNPNPSFLS